MWTKRANWWATKALGLRVAPKYIVDIKNGTNAAALVEPARREHRPLQQLRPEVGDQQEVQDLLRQGAVPPRREHDVAVPEHDQEAAQRQAVPKALAFSINMNQILDKAYQGLVNKASPTGLLPIWNKWIDKKVVKQYGFSYNPTKAKAILAAAGYKDVNGDGYVENKDGSKIDLQIVCPNGWSDWMTAIQVIAASAKQVGIKMTPGYPEYGTIADDRGHARFDLLLGNDRQMSNTPWTYYQYIYNLPILDNQATMNYERFTDQTAWNLTQAARQDTVDEHQGLQGRDVEAAEDVPAESARDSALVQRHVGDDQHEVLDQLAVASGLHYTPASWRNYWQMTGIDMLTHLKPAGT